MRKIIISLVSNTTFNKDRIIFYEDFLDSFLIQSYSFFKASSFFYFYKPLSTSSPSYPLPFSPPVARQLPSQRFSG